VVLKYIEELRLTKLQFADPLEKTGFDGQFYSANGLFLLTKPQVGVVSSLHYMKGGSL